MSDIFTSLVQRVMGIAETAVPRLPGRFESVEAWPEPEWDLDAAPVRQVETKPPLKKSRHAVEESSPDGSRVELRFRSKPSASAPKPERDPAPAVQSPPVVSEKEERKLGSPPPPSQRPTLTFLIEEVIEEVVDRTSASAKPPRDTALKQLTRRPDVGPDRSTASLPPAPRTRRQPHPILSASELQPRRSQPTPLQVRIGRIEVKAAPDATPRPSSPPRTTPRVSLTLHDYLARRGRS
jgi:hypothetical protein